MASILTILSFVAIGSILIIMVFTFKNKFSFLQGVYLSTGALLLSFISSVSSLKIQTGENVINTIIEDSFSQISEMINSFSIENLQKILGDVTSEQALNFKANVLSTLTETKILYTMIFPAIIILTFLGVSFLIFITCKNIIRLFKKESSPYPKLGSFKPSKMSAFVLVFSLICASFKTVPVISGAFLNIAIIILGIFAFCGFSLLDFKISKKIANTPLRILVYISVIALTYGLSAILLYALIIAAIFDSHFDFRHLKPRKEKYGE